MSKEQRFFEAGSEQRQVLDELCSKACDGRLTDAEARGLDAMLSESSEARVVYLRHMNLHSTLHAYLVPAEVDSAPAEERASAVVPRIPPGNVTALRPQPRPRVNPVLLAVAALAMFGAFFVAINWLWDLLPTPSGPGPALATLTQSHDAQWAAGMKRPELGEPIGRERLRLVRGRARIDFNRGSQIILGGKADLEILSENSARLHAGKLVAQVPSAATGFRIETASFDIIDLGTAFGVSLVEGGDVEVSVLEGVVEIAVRDAETGEMIPIQQLREGHSVIARPESLRVEKTEYAPESYEGLRKQP